MRKTSLLALLVLTAGMSLPVCAQTAFNIQPVAPGIWVHVGLQEEMTAANAGDVSNASFVVGDRCVAVIDTGGSFKVGQELRQAIRKVTDKPVCYVINTHGHPDHIFGNEAFVPDHPVFVGNARLPRAIAERETVYLSSLHHALGHEADGTEVVPPTDLVKNDSQIDLGNRVLTLTSWPTAHTEADLTVMDEKTHTAFLGDLLFVGRIPVVDGSLTGWLKAFDKLEHLPAEHVVPGHGQPPADWHAALEKEHGYLQMLDTQVIAALKKGLTLTEATKTVGLDARKDWLLYDGYHVRNVTAAYAELEWSDY